ncbi:segregation and condensation protein A [Acinetobacter rathckeae]|uniref:segregation and condensation protein A n=1 Tax=Acinetobacter rathckeae TaxID=2605272 RepID=UPI0018A27EFA|nr:segregation/condensation protein A [Acinetobacter rathckeae]MBF7686708.1 segregation/condensation protein A [Acinetobacter rathckeae]MBF7695759.1 segregation/condensation protein A [Acinetobacter rathckeae]
MNSALQAPVAQSPAIRVFDQYHNDIPDDLYIPPAAFQILLSYFEGPLDFLLYLIKKNGFDLLQLDIAPIATQYLSYIQQMKSLDIELTADYLVMAALLADLKSRLLLPRPTTLQIEDDPKQQLVERLEQYLRIKEAATALNALHVLDRDTFSPQIMLGQAKVNLDGFDANILSDALHCLFNRPEPMTHQVASENVSLEERMEHIEHTLQRGQRYTFNQLLTPKQGKVGMVVTFMAILELARQEKITILATGVEEPLSICGVQT